MPADRNHGRWKVVGEYVSDNGNAMYLGDGVYASFDGYSINLDLRGQPLGSPQFGHVCKIALEPDVLKSLIDYYDRLKKENKVMP